jgi:hypothetical protein
MKPRTLKQLPRLLRKFRPSDTEVEHYARLILDHEGQPASALPACQREAEIQLWAMGSMYRQRPGQLDPVQLVGA